MQHTKLRQGGTLLAIGLVAGAHFANDAVTSMFPALLPSLALKFRLQPADLALLVSLFAITTSLPQPLFGLLADRLGRRGVAAVGLGVSAALVAGMTLAPSAPWLWLILMLGGLGSSALHPAGVGLVRAASAQNPSLAVAVFSSVGMAGGALGPVLAIGVASAWGFEQLAWAAVPLLFIALLLANFGPRPVTVGIQVSPASLGRHLWQGPVAWLALVALLTNVVVLTFASAVPVWLVTERGLEETSPVIGHTLAAFSLAAAVGGIAGTLLTRWLQAAALIVASLALSVIALQAILLTHPGSPQYISAVAAAGALLGVHSPLLIAKAQELTPGAESAVAGVLLGATSGAAGLMYVGLGVAQASFGLGPTLAAVSLLVLPAAHLAAVTLRPRPPKLAAACRPECTPVSDCCVALTTPA